MCFYNQKKFGCDCCAWTGFAYKCNKEYRIGETCGLKFVAVTKDNSPTFCRICEKIETKNRRRKQETERLNRWERERSPHTASMEKSRVLISQLDQEIADLFRERDIKRRTL
ncbi:uncharacterized protein BDV17DRAFT_82859 [Aspergillus undulatus]|uniref:uncharacterized protein n=1 Tax=Aspergillus undulatus TaxID=1810928 RepID=UPI003CCD208E